MSIDEHVHVDVEVDPIAVEHTREWIARRLVAELEKLPLALPYVEASDEKLLAGIIHRITGDLFTAEPNVVLLPWPLQVVPGGTGWRADRRRRRARRRLMRALERGVDLRRKVRFRFEATLRGAIHSTEITGTVLT